jgi:acetyltransferase-like isoleucine patch superfamily enzyme
MASIWNAFIDALGAVLCLFLKPACARGWLYFPFVSQWLSGIPFSFGWKLRASVLSRLLPEFGKDVVIHQGANLEDQRSTLGSDVWISVNCYLDYCHIGDSVLIGPNATILAGGDVHRSDDLSLPIKRQGNVEKTPTKIGTGAWIGAASVVMADIGEHAIVGAGAVVTKPVPPYAVVVGNPARVLRMRNAKDSSAATN